MPESKTLSSAILKGQFLLSIKILLIWLSVGMPCLSGFICHGKEPRLCPGIDPQWDRGRIAFKDFCLFASAVTAIGAERRGALGLGK